MPYQFKAHQRHALHYIRILRITNELFKQGGDRVFTGLAILDREWVQIQRGRAWSEVNTIADEVSRNGLTDDAKPE